VDHERFILEFEYDELEEVAGTIGSGEEVAERIVIEF
jgi:hypothetical protein